MQRRDSGCAGHCIGFRKEEDDRGLQDVVKEDTQKLAVTEKDARDGVRWT